MKKEYPIDEAKLREVCKKWHSGEITARQAQVEMGLKPRVFYKKVKKRGLSKPGGYFRGRAPKPEETHSN